MPVRVLRHDSPLGRWLHAEWRPTALAGVVDALWYFEGTLMHPRERVFPDGRAELVVHLGPVYRNVDGPAPEPFAATCLSGLRLRAGVIEAPPGPCAVLGIRFRGPGAFAVLGRHVDDLAGHTADLADLTGTAAELAERCAEAEDPRGRLCAAARWVAERVARGPEPDAAVAWAAAEIERLGGAVSVSTLRERTGWSKSRFAETFRQQVGVPPKVLAQVVRFRRALGLLHREPLPLAEAALAAGYYDQPHLNEAFRTFAGCTPGAFLAARRYPSSVSVAEGAA